MGLRLRHLTVRQTVQHSALQSAGSGVLGVLRGSGMVRARPPPRKQLMEQRRAEIVGALTNVVPIMWLDNYNVLHYRRRRDVAAGHIDATASAVCAALVAPTASWKGHTTLQELLDRVPSVCCELAAMQSQLVSEVQQMLQANLPRQNVRVPCDVVRRGVIPVPWWPYDIVPHRITTGAGLVDALAYAREQREVLGARLLPLLLDVNVYWRTLKLMFSSAYDGLGAARALRRHPLVFGVWHAYKHLVVKTHEVFRPWWDALDLDALSGPAAAGTAVYEFSKLISLESSITTALLAVQQLLPELRAVLSGWDAHPDIRMKNLAQLQKQMLAVLLVEYLPTLFSFGFEVRQLYHQTRAVQTGDLARELMMKMLIFITKLDGRKREFEYSRSLAVMLLSWSELHSDLPAALFVEETLEASLSRLAAAAAAGYRIDTATDLGRVYSVECRAKLVPYDADDLVAQDRVEAMQLRLRKVLELCSRGKLPWLQTQDKTHRVAVAEWPATYVPAASRLLVADAVDFEPLLVRALVLLVSKGKRKQDADVAALRFAVETKLCRSECTPSLPLREQVKRAQAALKARFQQLEPALAAQPRKPRHPPASTQRPAKQRKAKPSASPRHQHPQQLPPGPAPGPLPAAPRCAPPPEPRSSDAASSSNAPPATLPPARQQRRAAVRRPRSASRSSSAASSSASPSSARRSSSSSCSSAATSWSRGCSSSRPSDAEAPLADCFDREV